MAQDNRSAAEESTEYTARQKANEEGWKLHFDALKHLTTLCTGSILILIAFLEKIFINPNWKWLVAITFGLFVLSIILSVYSMVMIASAVRDAISVNNQAREKWINMTSTFASIGYASFIFGIIFLIIFSIRNFYVW